MLGSVDVLLQNVSSIRAFGRRPFLYQIGVNKSSIHAKLFWLLRFVEVVAEACL